MKTLATIIALVTLTAAGTALARGMCGIPPIPPVPEIGCRRMEPVCQCNDRGDCWWVFVCVPHR